MTLQNIIEIILFLVMPIGILGFYLPKKLIEYQSGIEVGRKSILFWLGLFGLLLLILTFSFILSIKNIFTNPGGESNFTNFKYLTFLITGGIFFIVNMIIRQVAYRRGIRHEKVILDLGKIDKTLPIVNLVLPSFWVLYSLKNISENPESITWMIFLAILILTIIYWLVMYFSHILVIKDGIALATVTIKWATIKHYYWGSPKNDKVSLTIVGGQETKVNLPTNQQAQVDALFQSHHIKYRKPTSQPKPAWMKEPSTDWLEYQEKKKAILDKRPKIPTAPIQRRLASFLLDSCFIIFPLFYMAFIFNDWTVALGPYGRLITYAIIISYLTYYNSHKKNGQTIGQRLFNIAVVDRNYNFLTLGQSLFRTTILCLILILFRWDIPLLENPILGTFAGAIVTGGVIAMLYGLLSNRVTHQGLHDLLTDSYVVKWPPVSEEPLPQTPKKHLAITYGLFVTGFLLFNVITAVLPIPNLSLGLLTDRNFQALEKTLNHHENILSASIDERSITINNENYPQGTLHINLWVKSGCFDDWDACNDLKDEVAKMVLEKEGYSSQYADLTITIVSQFDIGFPVFYSTHSWNYSMADWLRNLAIIELETTHLDKSLPAFRSPI